MSVAFPNLNVKMVGTHTGISIGEDGPSQMGIEDVALACSLPNVVVVVPSDAACTAAATRALVEHQGPTYMRAGRGKLADIYTSGCPFQLGKAIQLRDGRDVTIIASGLMVAPALDAAASLAKQGVEARVLDMHTIKPIDADAIVAAARDTGAIVVAEEHLHHGGLGAVVSQVLCQRAPAPVEFVNVGDRYAESGDPDGLLQKYGLTPERIVEAAKQAQSRK
jgi:transketolase